MRAPLLVIPFSIYNLLALFGVPPMTRLPVPSVTLSVEELVIVLALVLIAIEIWRATTPTPRTAVRHVANLLLLLATMIEVALVPMARTGLFVVLIVAVAIDLVVGSYVSFVTKGRNIWVSNE